MIQMTQIIFEFYLNLHQLYFLITLITELNLFIEIFKRGSRGAARAAKSLRWSV